MTVDDATSTHREDVAVTTSTTPATAAPLAPAARLTNLDAIRGVAALAILVMNGVSFFLPETAYANLDAAGSETWLDRIIGVFGEIVVDEKGMALFSMLFGVGIVMFAERAQAKGRRSVWLSLWRNLLLLGIGFAHSLLWEGDILMVYAMAAPIILSLRWLSDRWAMVLGTSMLLVSVVSAFVAQASIGDDGEGLGTFWYVDPIDDGDAAWTYFLLDGGLRTLAFMLIGMALYRTGFLHGERPRSTYRRTALIGLGVGWSLAAVGVAINALNDYGPSTAIISGVPNTLALLPATLGATSALILWNQGGDSELRRRIRAVGRMALTNYLSATVLGLVVFAAVVDTDTLGRTEIFGFVVAVWAVQIWWSTWWLERFRFGPAEWAWRCATYRSWQPLRR